MYDLPNPKLMPFQFVVVVLYEGGGGGGRDSILGKQVSNSRETVVKRYIEKHKSIFIFGNRVTSQFISGEHGNSFLPSHGRASKLNTKKSCVSDVQTVYYYHETTSLAKAQFMKSHLVIYTTLTNFSTKYLMMYKVYTDVGGIK